MNIFEFNSVKQIATEYLLWSRNCALHCKRLRDEQGMVILPQKLIEKEDGIKYIEW